MGIVKELRTKNENLETKTRRLKRQLKQRNNDNRILSVKLEEAMKVIALLVQKFGGRVEIELEEMLEAEKLGVCPGMTKQTVESRFWKHITHSYVDNGNKITITCESIVGNLGFDVKNLLAFSSKEERRDYMGLFCSDRYEHCPYYQVIEKKYEED